MTKNIRLTGILLLLALCWSSVKVSAQIIPLGVQYYENQYMGNPAFAGWGGGLTLNLSYRNQWKSIPGSPVTMAFTGDYGKDKVGLGLSLYSDKAGLISRTRAVGTYAYHLPLNDDKQYVHFGISLGMMNERLDMPNIIADPNDQSAGRFNERKTYLDGDFGIAYTNEKVTLQGALPNLKKLLKKDDNNTVDRTTYLLAFAYKIGNPAEAIALEPKISFRAAKDIENIWDLGTNLKFPGDMISVMGMYHSNKSSTFGIGLNYKEFLIQGFYTSQLAAERVRTGGDFEINLKIRLFRNKDVRDVKVF
eukprot:gene17551-20943_t